VLASNVNIRNRDFQIMAFLPKSKVQKRTEGRLVKEMKEGESTECSVYVFALLPVC